MTLESRINQNRYIGNGATTQFPFTFKIWKTDQILVYIDDGQGEREVSFFCNISITASGGTVEFQEAPSAGTVIVLRRNMPYIQEDDYRNGTRFDAEEIEDRLDQDCAERQDLRLDVDRAIKAPVTSGKSPEEYEKDFWDAYADTLGKHSSVVSMHADVMAERPTAVAAIQGEGERQVQRVQGIASAIMADTGNGCMEMVWGLSSAVAVNGLIDISPMWYVVGRHHLQLFVNGVRQYIGKQYEEVGVDDSTSQSIKMLVPLDIGDTVDVWISHLHGKDVSSAASSAQDGLMTSADKVKLDGIASGSQVNALETVKVNGVALSIDSVKAVDVPVPVLERTTQTLASSVSAGTEVVVPSHAVNGGLLMVFHNGVLCEEGAGAQYVDFSTTSIKFNYDLPAGDVITAAAAAVRAS